MTIDQFDMSRLRAQTAAQIARSGMVVATIDDDFSTTADGALAATVPNGVRLASSGTGLPHIASNRLANSVDITDSANNYGYAQASLRSTPVEFGGMFSFAPGPFDDSGASTATIIMSRVDQAITDVLHLYSTQAGWNVQVRQNSGTFDSIAQGTYASSLAIDGTSYPFAVRLTGDTSIVLFTADGEQQTITDALIGDVTGRFLQWECAEAQSGFYVRWDSVYAVERRRAKLS